MVEQGDRRGTAERGLYTAAEEKYVLSGGIPTLFDPVEGTTTGRELTFYRADDTIVVDSGNGLRLVTVLLPSTEFKDRGTAQRSLPAGKQAT